MTKVDVGVVYRYDDEYFLAVSPSIFVTMRDRQLIVVAAFDKARARIHLSARQLCEHWSCGFEILDQISRDFLRKDVPPLSRQSSPFARLVRTASPLSVLTRQAG